MRTLYLIHFLILFIFGCSTIPTDTISDEEYTKLLIGTWVAQYSLDGDKKIMYGEKTYAADGTATGFISYRVKMPSRDYREIEHISYISKWMIENGIVVITDAIYNPPEPGSENVVLRDRIISIGENKAIFEDIDSGSTFERIRKN